MNKVNKDDETSTHDLDVPDESHLLIDQINTAFTHGELNELLRVCFVGTQHSLSGVNDMND